MPAPAFGDVVVLLPGITGSVLTRDGKDIWAPTPGAVLPALLSLGRSLASLEVEDDDWRADDLGDGVRARALVGAAHLIPGLWKIDVYSGVEAALVQGLGLVPQQNYFPFPYDWRRDNRASARQLEQQAAGWLAAWRESSGNADAQLVLVGHSMGGLVARYFVEALGGWTTTRAVVTFGTPFYGSLDAVDFLVNGFRKGLGPFRSDLTPVIRSMTSVHQLVPSYRCITSAGAAVTPADAALPGWRDSWTAHLVDFQREMDEQAGRNRSDPRFAANPVAYYPFAGGDQPTRQSAELAAGTLTVREDRAGKDEGGDGTVPLLAAALSGTQAMRTFAPERHSRLQHDSGLLRHLALLLSTLDAPTVEDLTRAADYWFALSLDDVVLPGEPAIVTLKPLTRLPDAARPAVQADVVVRREGAGVVTQRRVPLPWDTATEVQLGELATGTYVVEVDGARGAPVSDVFTVASQVDVDG